MEKMCCPIGFSEAFIAVFRFEMSQNNTKKNFVGYNVGNAQHDTICVSSRLFEEIGAVFK